MYFLIARRLFCLLRLRKRGLRRGPRLTRWFACSYFSFDSRRKRMRAMGIRRFLGRTPYQGAINDKFADYFKAAGFDVAAMLGIPIDFKRRYDLSREEICSHIKNAFPAASQCWRNLSLEPRRLAHRRCHRSGSRSRRADYSSGGSRHMVGIETSWRAPPDKRFRTFTRTIPLARGSDLETNSWEGEPPCRVCDY